MKPKVEPQLVAVVEEQSQRKKKEEKEQGRETQGKKRAALGQEVGGVGCYAAIQYQRFLWVWSAGGVDVSWTKGLRGRVKTFVH